MLKLIDPSTAGKSLLREITTNGVTHGTPENPILTRDGQTGSAWVMSYLGAGLREPWLSSSCDGLLRILEHFDGKQLATMGLAASSLLSGCILRSKRGHSGLMVRSEAKAHGSGNQIEGLGDTSEPVVIIDDAIGTGYSALKCAEILEANGFEVEGVVCVVSFSYDSGYGLLEERGFKVASLFDLYDDLAPIMQSELIPDSESYKGATVTWDNEVADSGLGVFALTRAALHYGNEFGAMPQPPEFLAHPLNCDGGLTISLRQKGDGRSIARGSVWCLPDDQEISPGEMLFRACWQIIQSLPEGENLSELLGNCNLAINCFGAMETCTPGSVKNDEYGLIFQSKERPWVMGGALPGMPGISDNMHQLMHGAFTNTGLRPLERYELYRHTVTKLVEPDAIWPPGGQSKNSQLAEVDDASQAKSLLEYAAEILAGKNAENFDSFFFWNLDRIFISIYDDDKLLACAGSECSSHEDFTNLVLAAAQDPRMVDAPTVDKLSLQITVLHEAWSEVAPLPFVTGKDALAVNMNEVETILLPNVALELNQDTTAFMEMLLHKASAKEGLAEYWTRYSCKSWSMLPGRGAAIEGTSLPIASRQLAPNLSASEHAQMWSRWLSQCLETGLVPEVIHPLTACSDGMASQTLQAKIQLQLARHNTNNKYSFSDLPVPASQGSIDIEATAYTLLVAKQCGSENLQRLADTLCQSAASECIRTNGSGFWTSISALAGLIKNHETISNRTIQRRASLPILADQRLLRLSSLIDWQRVNPDADLLQLIKLEIQWLRDFQSETGAFNFLLQDADLSFLTAESAEILAKASDFFPSDGLLEQAELALKYLTSLSITLDTTSAGIRKGCDEVCISTAATAAALGAFCTYREASK